MRVKRFEIEPACCAVSSCALTRQLCREPAGQKREVGRKEGNGRWALGCGQSLESSSLTLEQFPNDSRLSLTHLKFGALFIFHSQ